MLPASINKALITGLLRQKLGFNGLVVTDSSAMAGLAAHLSREQMVPMTIAAGCDMFLFTKNLEEDIFFMEEGYRKGIISEERLDEAVTRILALKASLGLQRKRSAGTLVPTAEEAEKKLGNPVYREWSRECADRSITLVKEQKRNLSHHTGKISPCSVLPSRQRWKPGRKEQHQRKIPRNTGRTGLSCRGIRTPGRHGRGHGIGWRDAG